MQIHKSKTNKPNLVIQFFISFTNLEFEGQ